MEVKDLKNYRRPLKVMEGLPKDVESKMENDSIKVVQKSIGWIELIKVLVKMFKENRRIAAHDLSPIREKGLKDEAFIHDQVQMTAFFSALSQVEGQEKAMEVFNKVMDAVTEDVMGATMPEPEDFQKFDDPFKAFHDYFMALVEVDKEEGIHEFEVIEDGEDAFQVNVTYCAYCEIAKRLELIEACQPSCYADEVFFPDYCKKFNTRFVRKGTLARGNKVCDFRFERIK